MSLREMMSYEMRNLAPLNMSAKMVYLDISLYLLYTKTCTTVSFKIHLFSLQAAYPKYLTIGIENY